MTLTRVRDLVLLAVLFGVLGYFATRAWYLRLPAFSWPPGAALLLVAAFELALAARLRELIGHNPEAKPMEAITVARWIVVGRASAVAGAIVGGIGAGFTAHVATRLGDFDAATGDVTAGSVFVVGAIGLTVAGCLLERAGVAPPPDRPDRTGRAAGG